jgi:phage FluMu protein Com
MVDVAYKDLHWVFHGKGMLVVKCRRCGELNSFTIGDRSEWAATA